MNSTNLNLYSRYINWFREAKEIEEGEKTFKIDVNDASHKFLENCQIHGDIVVPFSFYLNLAWGIYKSLNKDRQMIATVFDDIHVHNKSLSIRNTEMTEFTVMVQKGNN